MDILTYTKIISQAIVVWFSLLVLTALVNFPQYNNSKRLYIQTVTSLLHDVV